MTSDPNMQWDGQQWQRWDGVQWIPQGVSAPAVQSHQPATQPAYPSAAGPIVAPVQGGGSGGGSANSAHMIIAWILAILTLGYLLPWAIAATRGKSNAGAIAILNLLLGWTVVGWVVALVMACGAETGGGGQQFTVVNTVAVNNGNPYGAPAPGYAPQNYAPPAPAQGPPTAYQPQPAVEVTPAKLHAQIWTAPEPRQAADPVEPRAIEAESQPRLPTEDRDE